MKKLTAEYKLRLLRIADKQVKEQAKKARRLYAKDLRKKLSLLANRKKTFISTREDIQEKSKLEIHAHVSRLTGIMDRLEKLDSGLRLNQKFTPLYEAITGGDFESANIERGNGTSERYKRIILLSDKVRDECEDWFQRYHKG